MARKNVVLVIVLLIGLTFSACGGKSTPDVQALETQTAAKIYATQTAAAPIPTDTPKPTAPPKPTVPPKPTIPPKPTVPQAAVDAVKSLRRMKSATDVGINYQQYSSRIIDLKGDVDEAIAQLSDRELKTELTLAMEAYQDALTLWNHMVQSSLDVVPISTTAGTQAEEPAYSLQKKYSIPETTKYDIFVVMTREAIFSTIWAAASEHVDRASELVGQK